MPATDAAWTGGRRDWQDLADRLVGGALAYMSESGATIDAPGRPSRQGAWGDGLEGFARVFLMHAFRIGGEDADPRPDRTARFLAGLAAGAADGPDGWPRPEPSGRATVEAASIASALWASRRHTWDLLDDDVQAHLAYWLEGAALAETPANNWRLFCPAIGGFLNAVGRLAPEVEQVARDRCLLLDAWGAGDGWVSDGPERSFDYYNAYALHYYPLLAGGLGDERASAREAQTRARAYLAAFPSLIAPGGEPVYFGRSLTYRFGVTATVGAAALAGCLPWEPGRARALASDVIGSFLARGAVAPDDTLRRGWHGESDAGVQDYSGPLASYWAAKAFVPLLLPATHDFWAQSDQPPGRPDVRVLRGPGLLLAQSGGAATLANHGSVNRITTVVAKEVDDPLYSRLQYSSHTEPADTPRARAGGFAVRRRRRLSSRGRVVPTGSGADWAASRAEHRIASPVRYVRVEGGGIRRKRQHDTVAGELFQLTIARGSWSVHAQVIRGGSAELVVFGAPAVAGARRPRVERSRDQVTLRGEEAAVSLAPVDGLTASGLSRPTGAGAFGPRLAFATLRGRVQPDQIVAVATCVSAADTAPEAPPTGELARDGALIVTWSDGASHEVSWRDGLVARSV